MQELAPDIPHRNYSKEPLTKAEIGQILAGVKSTAEVLNTRHKTAKENGWKDKAPSKAAFTKAVLEENNLLRRPILVKGKQAIVARDLDAVRELLS